MPALDGPGGGADFSHPGISLPRPHLQGVPDYHPLSFLNETRNWVGGWVCVTGVELSELTESPSIPEFEKDLLLGLCRQRQPGS